MKNKLNANVAGKILLSAFGLLLVLHVLIIARVVPGNIMWGGRINADQSNLTQLEIVALALTVFFTGLVVVKIKLIKTGKPNKLIAIGMWVVFAYLVVNTLANFASGVSAEILFFGPLTVVMALCALRLAVEK